MIDVSLPVKLKIPLVPDPKPKLACVALPILVVIVEEHVTGPVKTVVPELFIDVVDNAPVVIEFVPFVKDPVDVIESHNIGPVTEIIVDVIESQVIVPVTERAGCVELGLDIMLTVGDVPGLFVPITVRAG